MQLIYTRRDGKSWDITPLADTVTWSGDYKQAARTLRVTMAFRQGTGYPQALVEAVDNGEVLRLMQGDLELFRGYIFVITSKLAERDRELLAYDGAIYLTKSSISANFSGSTATAITNTVAKGVGVDVGTLPSDGGMSISTAVIGGTAYSAIISAWTKVSRAGDKKYLLRMDGWKLTVRWMGDQIARYLIDPARNLVSGEVSRSIEECITRAIVNDSNGYILGTASNAEDILNYGVLQAVETSEEGVAPAAQAKEMLKEADNQITLSNIIGGPHMLDLVTGHAVGVRAPGLNLTGKFFILNDEHTFQGDRHSVSLGISYKALMDEQELQALQETASETEEEATSTPTGTKPPEGEDPPTGNPFHTAELIGTA